MVGASISSFDDGVGRTAQFIMQPPFNETAYNRFGRRVCVKREISNVWITARPGHRSVHGLDDITTDTEVAQGRLKAGLQGPLRRADSVGQTQPFELGGAADQEPPQLAILSTAAGA